MGWVFVVIGNVVFCGVGSVFHHWKCSFLWGGWLLSLEMFFCGVGSVCCHWKCCFLWGGCLLSLEMLFFVGWVVFAIIGNVVFCGVGVCCHWKCCFLWGG